MVKQVFWIIIFCLAIFTNSQPSLALTVQEVPNPRQVYGGWVTDITDLLSSQTETKLNGIISRLERKNGSEIAVVTVPETAPADTPKQFATQLFNSWGIGKQGENNGVLFLISQSDRRVEIETGYGIKEILPNAVIKEIINQHIIPYFKQSNFDDGTLLGIQELIGYFKKIEVADNVVISSNQNYISQELTVEHTSNMIEVPTWTKKVNA
jgi:uncharacterized protein